MKFFLCLTFLFAAASAQVMRPQSIPGRNALPFPSTTYFVATMLIRPVFCPQLYCQSSDSKTLLVPVITAILVPVWLMPNALVELVPASDLVPMASELVVHSRYDIILRWGCCSCSPMSLCPPNTVHLRRNHQPKRNRIREPSLSARWKRNRHLSSDHREAAEGLPTSPWIRRVHTRPAWWEWFMYYWLFHGPNHRRRAIANPLRWKPRPTQ